MSKPEGFSRKMTVANIREIGESDYFEVVFLESARFYRLSRKNPRFNENLALLREAAGQGRLLNIKLSSIDDATIEDVLPSDR